MIYVENYYIIIKVHNVITTLLWNIYNTFKIKNLAFYYLLKHKLFSM